MKQWCVRTNSEEETIAFGEQLGAQLTGGEVIELSSDLGGGKTTLTKGIAQGIGSRDIVSSPTFTISNEYQGTSLRIKHYDFYRLDEIGIMANEMTEVLQDKRTVSVVEWAGEAHDLFPQDVLLRLEIKLMVDDENARELTLFAGDSIASKLRTLELESC